MMNLDTLDIYVPSTTHSKADGAVIVATIVSHGSNLDQLLNVDVVTSKPDGYKHATFHIATYASVSFGNEHRNLREQAKDPGSETLTQMNPQTNWEVISPLCEEHAVLGVLHPTLYTCRLDPGYPYIRPLQGPPSPGSFNLSKLDGLLGIGTLSPGVTDYHQPDFGMTWDTACPTPSASGNHHL